LRNSEKKIQLAKYRLKQAEDSISEAECLLSGNESPRSIMNRAYYAMFYGVLALLVFEQYYSSKHAGVISYFNKRFIKEGVFPKPLGHSINKAFEMRQEGDYREYVELDYEQVKPFIGQAKQFVEAVREYLEKSAFPHV
jgi:uncharacterized protein (UPF0332 family)